MATNGAMRGSYRTVTTSGNVLSGDYLLVCNATAGSFTMTLPPAAMVAGRIYVFKRINAGVNTITVDAYGAETIDGVANHVLSPQWNSITIISNGITWYIISHPF